MPDYTQSKIYRVCSYKTDRVYIGSTVQPLSKRINEHRNAYVRYKKGLRGFVSSFDIMDVDLEGAKCVLLETYPCTSKEQLRARERYWIEELGSVCVNRNIPSRTRQEWLDTTKEERQAYQSDYYLKHREPLLAAMRGYQQHRRSVFGQMCRAYGGVVA